MLSCLLATDSVLFAGGSTAAFVSRDHGVSWSALDSIGPLTSFSDFALVRGTLIAATSDGLYYSTDAGGEWKSGAVTSSTFTFHALAWDESGVYSVDYIGNVFRSTDTGRNWSHIGNPHVGGTSIAVSVHGLFVAGPPPGVLRSTDMGQTWTILDATSTGWTNSLRVLQSTLYATKWGGGVRSTSDGGTTWTSLNTGLPTQFVSDIVESNSLLFVGSVCGVQLSTDRGENWITPDSTMTGNRIWQLAANSHFLYAADTIGTVWYHHL